MKKLALTLSVALASLLATTGFAQTKGEVDADQSKAVPAQAATKAQKAAAKQARKAEGTEAAKAHPVNGEATPTTADTQKVSKTDKKLAAAKRKEQGTEARKMGASQTGESK